MDPVLLLRSPVDDDQGSRIRREGPRLLRPCLCCRICRSSGGRPCPYAVPHMLSGFAALATIVPVPAHRWAAVGAPAACSAAGHAPCCVTSASLLGGHREGARPWPWPRTAAPPTCPSPPRALFHGRCRGLKDHHTRLSLRFRNGAVRFHTFFRFGEPESRRRKPISPHLISGDSDTHVAREGLKRKRLTFSKRFLKN